MLLLVGSKLLAGWIGGYRCAACRCCPSNAAQGDGVRRRPAKKATSQSTDRGIAIVDCNALELH